MTLIIKNEAEILSRVIDPKNPSLSPEAAKSILAMSFSAEDIARMNDLSDKASDGALSEEEQDELNCYERVGHLLGLLQSKARRSLNGGAAASSES